MFDSSIAGDTACISWSEKSINFHGKYKDSILQNLNYQLDIVAEYTEAKNIKVFGEMYNSRFRCFDIIVDDNFLENADFKDIAFILNLPFKQEIYYVNSLDEKRRLRICDRHIKKRRVYQTT